MQFLATQSQSLSAPSFVPTFIPCSGQKAGVCCRGDGVGRNGSPPPPSWAQGGCVARVMCLPFPFWLEHGNASDFSLSFRRTLQFRWDDHFTLSRQRRGRRRSKTWWRRRCEDGTLRPPARVNAIATPRIKRKREQQLGWGPSRIGTRCILGV